MRAPALRVIALVLVLATGMWRAHAVADAERDGFDHYLHDRNVAVSGADPVACVRCHELKAGRLVGAPGHGACFGDCHGPRPAALANGKPIRDIGERVRICAACHAETALAAPAPTRAALAAGYPPYTLHPDHALVAGHLTHAATPCASCHTSKPQAPHQRCAGCHDGSGSANKGPAMAACAGCHTPASGAPESLAMVRTGETQIFVTKTFSHARHAGRGGAGADCVTCHAAVRTTDDRQLPRVPMAACGVGGCHDGAGAFAVTGECTKCHRDVPTLKYKVARPIERFGHARPGHAASLACGGCHPLATGGEPRVAGHAACASCHAEDFARRVPTICGACHNATEPWRPLVPDRAPPDRSELGATLDHAKHPGPCEACHSVATAAVELRPPHGHRSCTGAACHAVSSGPAPTLATCEGCHRLGLAEQRARARAAASWSVRVAFTHSVHKRAADGSTVACTTCHVDMRGASTLDILTPPKSTCASCHDGKTSFKLTGTGCTRCHLGVAAPPGRP